MFDSKKRHNPVFWFFQTGIIVTQEHAALFETNSMMRSFF
ncbi:hypothetical protein HMPREF9370_2027 [Neisseria wadsworthii 9715]|uniref:Uncharacterized protein n=1 Tax=Neisseria wadsworthii 9715 TaxID=1030841 RepID=G4CSG7_9NEIS|nr:hypothetical protein HMPREF9370_2027 [Neisseria wadsworthii 9715]